MTLDFEPGHPVVRIRLHGIWRYGHVVAGVTRGPHKGQLRVRVPVAAGGTRTVRVPAAEAWCPACGLPLAGVVARKIPGGITLRKETK